MKWVTGNQEEGNAEYSTWRFYKQELNFEYRLRTARTGALSGRGVHSIKGVGIQKGEEFLGQFWIN